MSKQTVTLVHPDGKRTYETDNRTEIVNLKARGYTVKAPAKSSSKS